VALASVFSISLLDPKNKMGGSHPWPWEVEAAWKKVPESQKNIHAIKWIAIGFAFYGSLWFFKQWQYHRAYPDYYWEKAEQVKKARLEKWGYGHFGKKEH